MEVNKETSQKIQQMQLLEQNLQNLLMQKQAFQIELNETSNAEQEIKKTKEDAYKLLGNIMIKVNREDLEKQIKEKKDVLSLRLKSIEKQEKALKENLEKLRQEVIGKIK